MAIPMDPTEGYDPEPPFTEMDTPPQPQAPPITQLDVMRFVFEQQSWVVETVFQHHAKMPQMVRDLAAAWCATMLTQNVPVKESEDGTED